MDLFEKEFKKNFEKNLPLAVKMRPRSIEEFVGQSHILGEGKLLRRAIAADKVTSLIFYGPPGTGKTALGFIISSLTKSHFERINAVTSNVQEMRSIIDGAKKRLTLEGKRTILFIDEIHRFNKAQQDVLLPHIESQNPILIGTTTHNPFFSIVPALVSRSQIFEFHTLSETELLKILNSALLDKERGLGKLKIKIDDNALKFFAKVSNGDARKALGALELAVLTTKVNEDGIIYIDLNIAQESIQKKAVLYDRGEDEHYDTASAFIKSMRGSDVDATLYYLAKMLYAGEDPRFVARRIVICASEDVGNADPQALILANAALQISEFVGLPEARIPLAQAAVYIACAPKSNAAYMGLENATKDVSENKTIETPDYLKDKSYKGAEKLGHGEGYKYAHDYKNHYVKQEYMSQKRKYYFPADIGYEKKIKEWLEKLAKEEDRPQKTDNR